MGGRYGFIWKRLLHTVPVVLVVLVATFILLKLVPGDPAVAVAGPRASPAAIAAVRERLGLDRPVWEQFGNYVGDVATGDLGTSAVSGVKVRDIIGQNSSVTLWVVTGGTVVALLISIPAALAAARRPGSATDRAVRMGALLTLTVPPFWIGILLLSFLAVRTGWFPIGGWPDDAFGRLRMTVLPAVTLGLAVAPVLVRSLRASLIEVLGAEHVTVARAAGVTGRDLTRRFVLRNAVVPTVALLATIVGYLLFGTVLVEATFGLPGLGQTMIQAAVTRDFPVVQGLTLVFGVGTVLVNLLGDVTLAVLDPRIRLST